MKDTQSGSQHMAEGQTKAVTLKQALIIFFIPLSP